MTKTNNYFDIKLIVISLLCSFVASFLVVNILIPCGLYPAGFSGICRLTTDLVKDYANFELNYAIMYFSLNLIACLFTFKYIGKKFSIYSALQFTLTSIFCYFLKPLFVVEDVLLFVIFGGIINGIISGLTLRFGFSTGGTDFISVYYSSKHNKSFWNQTLFVNICVIIIAGMMYGITVCMYSIIFQFFTVTMIKQIHNRYTYKTLTIITKIPENVSQEIIKQVRHGITEIKSEGYYSKTESTMLYMVVNSFQYLQIINIVKKVDPKAFINVQETKEIYGNYYQKPLD